MEASPRKMAEILHDFPLVITCWFDNILDLLGYRNYINKMSITTFLTWLRENSKSHTWLMFVANTICLLHTAGLHSVHPSWSLPGTLPAQGTLKITSSTELPLNPLLEHPLLPPALKHWAGRAWRLCVSHPFNCMSAPGGRALLLSSLHPPESLELEDWVQNLAVPCEYTKTHQLVYFKWGRYMICELCVNKGAISTYRLCSQPGANSFTSLCLNFHIHQREAMIIALISQLPWELNEEMHTKHFIFCP